MEMMERTKAMMSSEKADGESSPSITERFLDYIQASYFIVYIYKSYNLYKYRL